MPSTMLFSSRCRFLSSISADSPDWVIRTLNPSFSKTFCIWMMMRGKNELTNSGTTTPMTFERLRIRFWAYGLGR